MFIRRLSSKVSSWLLKICMSFLVGGCKPNGRPKRKRTDVGKADARQYTLVYLLLTTAIKKSECLGIHLNHIDLAGPEGPILFVKYAVFRWQHMLAKESP